MSEKEERWRSAAGLLLVLKQFGGSAKGSADYIGVSPTTLSHWKTVGEGSERKVGQVNDEHLDKIVSLILYQIDQGFSALNSMVDMAFVRQRESLLLYKGLVESLEAQVNWMKAHIEAAEASTEHLAQMLEEVLVRYGVAQLKSLLKESDVSWRELPGLDQIVTAPTSAATSIGTDTAARKAIEEYVQSQTVSAEDVRKIQQNLLEFLKKRDEQTIQNEAVRQKEVT